MDILQELYSSEINASISWEWDAGFAVKIGNGFNENWEAEMTAMTIAEAEVWLKEKAIELYPNSVFAKSAKGLSAGQQAVGLSFNPSGDRKVVQIKSLSAKLFDIVEQHVPSATQDSSAFNWRRRKMRDIALGAILTAQMWAVKVITLTETK